LHNAAVAEIIQGNQEQGRALLEQSLALARGPEGNPNLMAFILHSLGELTHQQGDLVQARTLLEESLELRRSLGDTLVMADALADLGEVVHAQGDDDQALAFCREGLQLSRSAGARRIMAACLESIAGIAVRERPHLSARLLGAAAALRDADGTPATGRERATADRTLAAAREALGDDAFDAAWREGRAMPPEQVVAEATDF
jgi:tetratricopeptide (TPR) repeat protein